MSESKISIYENIRQTKSKETIPIDLFFTNVESGKWQDQIFAFRNGKLDKKKLPNVTISGEFSARSKNGLTEHSGFICMDIDNLGADAISDAKSSLGADPYVYASFVSCSGNGLAIIFKINPKFHDRAFAGLSKYLFDEYDLIIDPSGKDVSRARFVSFDPDIIVNESASKFTKYPKIKPKVERQQNYAKTIFVQSDFDEVINEISQSGRDLVDDYYNWLTIGFAFADRFGEAGRQYFHIISRNGAKYDYDKCDKQYTACIKHKPTGRTVTMGTFYYLCKKNGIETVSDKTKIIARTATQAKKGKRNKADTLKLLEEVENIAKGDSKDIIDQVFDEDINFDSDDSLVDELEVWLRQNYEIKWNALTRKLELNGQDMHDRQINSVYISAKKIFDKVSKDLLLSLIGSEFIKEYNPLKDFMKEHAEMEVKDGYIRKLAETITGNQDPEFVYFCVKKWLLGVVSSIYGDHCSLMLILSGNIQGTGKTQFFRRLLPREIRSFYAESKLDKGTDDEILMTQNLIIMDDEMGGKSKADERKLKELTSKEWFSLREPYGRANVDLKRLAVMAGTSNDNELLNDPTGNRRMLPVNVISIDHEAYNSIDKVLLLMEAKKLYDAGENSELSREEIQYLNENTKDFESASIERELIMKYFKPAESSDPSAEWLTNSEIKISIENQSAQRNLSQRKIGMELKSMDYFQKTINFNGRVKRCYALRKLFQDYENQTENGSEDDVPF